VDWVPRCAAALRLRAWTLCAVVAALRPGPRQAGDQRRARSRRGDPEPEEARDGADVSHPFSPLLRCLSPAVRLSYVYGIGNTTAKAILAETVRCPVAAALPLTLATEH
jgi:hypothetical protein